MLARCQFGMPEEGGCGATLTYPIKGYPWRNNVVKSYLFDISDATRVLLFAEVYRIRSQYPQACLSHDQVWSDSTEKANGITRDRAEGVLCYTVGIFVAGGEPEVYYSFREDAEALQTSALFQVISALIAPFEQL